ncbi:MAG: hypothetical protein QOK37_1025 [Thermoanaerobaculia bacterium]|jgi:hypothetical protein|nr:hypothetical protein [Thermoanaerobaculia bacterium]
MRRFRFVVALVFLALASAIPLEALPPGSCFGSECLMCTITVYSDDTSTLSCGYTDGWGYCTCRMTVGEGCSSSGNCYYHP